MAVSTIPNSLVSPRDLRSHGYSFRRSEKSYVCNTTRSMFANSLQLKTTKCVTGRVPVIIRAGVSGADGRSSGASAGIFIGGFLLGGVLVGALGCVYAPQISKVLVGENRKELMKKLPKFIYDEEKEFEKKRELLGEKIHKLNTALEEASKYMASDRYYNEDDLPYSKDFYTGPGAGDAVVC